MIFLSVSLYAIDPTFILAGLYTNSVGLTILYEDLSSFANLLFSNCSFCNTSPLELLTE